MPLGRGSYVENGARYGTLGSVQGSSQCAADHHIASVDWSHVDSLAQPAEADVAPSDATALEGGPPEAAAPIGTAMRKRVTCLQIAALGAATALVALVTTSTTSHLTLTPPALQFHPRHHPSPPMPSPPPWSPPVLPHHPPPPMPSPPPLLPPLLPAPWQCAELDKRLEARREANDILGTTVATGLFCTSWGRDSEYMCKQGFIRARGGFRLCHWDASDSASTLWSRCRDGDHFACPQTRRDNGWPAGTSDAGLTEDFELRCYLDRYADVRAMYCPDDTLSSCDWYGVRMHWDAYGRVENRTFGCVMPPMGLQVVLNHNAVPLRFLLVANNPLIASARWEAAPWIVVRFNDCQVDWPPRITVEREVVAINSFFDDALNCSRKLGRVFDHVVKVVASDLVCCGGELTDSFLPAPIWQQGATYLSIGASMILHLKTLFPTAPIVAAGFTFHREDQWNATWHHFEEEHELITNLSGVYLLPSAADIDAFAFDSV